MPVPRLRLSVTIFCAFILLSFYTLITLSYWALPRPGRVASPERALAHVVSNTMLLEAAERQTSGWMRILSNTMDPPQAKEETAKEAIRWYEELLTVSHDPVAQTHLYILQAEAGQRDKVRLEMAHWRSQPEPSPTLALLVQEAYLEDKPVSEYRFRVEQAVLSELLPEDWFRDRLFIQIARRSPHPELAAHRERAIAVRGEWLFRWHLAFVFMDLCLLLLGGLACVKLFRRRNKLAIGTASIPPPWSSSTGIAVLTRGGAWSICLIMFFFSLEGKPLIQTLLLPVISLPVLWLAHKHLVQPAHVPFGRTLGLSVDSKRLLFLVVCAGMALEITGNAALGIAGNLFHLMDHWTEWFDPDLAWGGPTNIAASFFQSVVIAPIFEEIIFRGLLFTTLRRRFNWVVSAILSSGIFALVHGYGILGFLTVFLSGVVWAWMMEKTRSLIPGIIAHAADNLIFTTGVLEMLRAA